MLACGSRNVFCRTTFCFILFFFLFPQRLLLEEQCRDFALVFTYRISRPWASEGFFLEVEAVVGFAKRWPKGCFEGGQHSEI